MRKIVLIAHNLRSTHNVGSLLRTADGLGLQIVYFTGYTPFPMSDNDPRLSHIARKLDHQINKTALGAQNSQTWEHASDVKTVIRNLRADGYTVAALEQTTLAISLPDFNPPDKIAVIIGREVEGLESEIIKLSDLQLEIPMLGKKESFNVAQATAITMYHLRFVPFKI